MIKNDRQHGIIRGRVERLQRLQDELLDRLENRSVDRARTELELKVVRAEIRRLQAELDDYEALKEGRGEIGTAKSLEDLPRLLIRARVAAGLTQAELAEGLGLKEQQIQRYEATDYESASLSRLIEVAGALDLQLGSSIEREDLRYDAATVLRRLGRVGLTREFLEKRFMPAEEDQQESVVSLVGRLAHVYGWPPEDILAGRVTQVSRALAPVAFNKPRNASEARSAALAGYADYLTRLLVRAIATTTVDLPADPVELHARMGGPAGPVTFATALDTLWAAGVAILPLRERGGFQAAYWRHGERDIVVINAMQREESRWLFYLLHEIGHIHERSDERALLEDAPGHDNEVTEVRERRANEFATAALFGGRSEELFQLVLDKSGGKPALIQRAVHSVARRDNVDAGALAFSVAHRLAERGHDWWGAAMNLQGDESDPWRIARDSLIERLDRSALEPLDADLLARALDITSLRATSEGGETQ
ncbi:MAG TPA: helix-turn-helix domain-containing protein [Actinomycetes bacterium]|jgi:transcriptional regulator with XRE-family HTH domain|nr:helix-turn-helix domain-containing protein [Actinomycetes bacterium]